MISPSDVRAYTVFESVLARTDEQMLMDILQAKQDIFSYAGHKFDDPKYAVLPEEVKLAFIKLTEYYGLQNSDESIAKGIKTEKIGDYSYTISDNVNSSAQRFSLSTLLADHVMAVGSNRMTFKMRSI